MTKDAPMSNAPCKQSVRDKIYLLSRNPESTVESICKDAGVTRNTALRWVRPGFRVKNKKTQINSK